MFFDNINISRAEQLHKQTLSPVHKLQIGLI